MLDCGSQENIDNSILSPVLGEIRTLIENQVLSFKESLLPSVIGNDKQLREIRSDLSAIAKQLSATRELTNSLALGTVAAVTPRRMLNPVVAAQLHSADMFLRSEIISAVSISSISKYVIASSSDLTEDQVLEIMRLLLFAPGAHLRKKARKSDLGRKFVELRIRIIKNMVFNCHIAVQKDSIALFQPLLRLQDASGLLPEPSDATVEDRSSLNAVPSNPEAARMKKVPFRPPAWTAKGFIGREDVDIAVGEIVKQEVEESAAVPDGIDSMADGGLVQTQTSKRRKTAPVAKITMREEISREIIKYMWKRWTDWFGNSRNEARKSFTLDLGVVFLEPNSRWKPMCSCNAVDEYYEVLDTVPITEHSSVFRTSYEATTRNLRLFDETKNKFPNFVLTCQYSVEVFEDLDQMAQNQGGQEMTLRRSINLLQVAANFLTAYFQVSSLEIFLGGSENSLRLLFIVALEFSEIVSRASRPRVGNNSRDLVCSEAKEFGLLIPGDTGRIAFITEKCLRMTRGKYDSINHENGGSIGSAEEGAPGGGICSDDEDVQNIFI